MTVIVASVLAVLAVPLLGYALMPGDRSAAARFELTAPKALHDSYLGESIRDRVVIPVIDAVARQARRLTPGGFADSTTRNLVHAGLAGRLPLEGFVALKSLLITAGLVGGFAISVGAEPRSRLLWTLLLGFVGFVAPDAYVRRRADARQREIVAALPDVLDQLTVLLEAGLGFNSAVDKIARSTSGPLVDEFARALHAIRLGRPRNEALEDIATRTGTQEVRQFVSAIKQADGLGVPMARVARVQSEHMREIRRLHSEEQAMRLPVKLVFPMVLCMLPALFVVLLGPVAIRILGSGL
ncbi:MAG: type II secretion system F family protein [Acidimicrobiia bacterium]|nr:type II secretion system F family protein [Acidimicrobiia bacterium]